MMSLIFSISYSVNSPALYMRTVRNLNSRRNRIGLPLVEIDLGDFQDEVRESSTNTLDSSDTVHGFTSSVNVGVLDTQDVSEFASFSQYNAALLRLC